MNNTNGNNTDRDTDHQEESQFPVKVGLIIIGVMFGLTGVFLLLGCASVKYTDPSGAKYSNHRLFISKSIKKATVEVHTTTAEGIPITKEFVLEGYSTSPHTEALKAVTESAVKAAIEGATP